MRPSRRLLTATRFVVALAALLTAAGDNAAALDILPQHHGWGRFSPGAWQLARIVTETLDPDGNVVDTSTSDVRTTLLSVTNRRIRLQLETDVEVRGKRFSAPIITISQGLHGEESGQRETVEDLADQQTDVAGTSIRCQVGRFMISLSEQEKSVQIFYSPKVSPYILRRETVTRSRLGGKTTDRSSVQLVAIDKPYDVLGEELPTSHFRTDQSTEKGSMSMLAIHTAKVPGEVVAYTSTEEDENGRLVRRSRLELLDFGLEKPSSNLREMSRRQYRKYMRRNKR